MALAVGLLALRTTGVAFMIVTLMFAQAGYLAILYFGAWTRGDEGFVIDRAARAIGPLDLTDDATRYLVALALFAVALLVNLRARPLARPAASSSRSARTRSAPGCSATIPCATNSARSPSPASIAALPGAAYGLLFGYVGATFASIQYSILPLLYVLLGGAGTVLGPFVGTLLMFYLIDLSSAVTDAHLMVVGVALLALVLFAPRGLLGALRARFLPWLP